MAAATGDSRLLAPSAFAECGSSDPFAARQLRDDVRFLSSPMLGGRFPGTAGDRATRDHIVRRFRCLGLQPGAGGSSYQQRFVNSDRARTANVVGLIRGGDPRRSDEIVVVGAHHDHLGRRRGRLFPGANDNASGVATLLSIAAHMAAGAAAPRRTVAFVAFGAEETLTVPPFVEGSDLFVRHPPPGLSIEDVAYMVNIDMLGSYSARRLAYAYGAKKGTPARAAIEELRGDFPRLELRLGGWPGRGDSDFWPFFRAGIPYVYMHTDDPRCLHEPCDRARRLDYGPMSKLAELTGRLTAELAGERPIRPAR